MKNLNFNDWLHLKEFGATGMAALPNNNKEDFQDKLAKAATAGGDTGKAMQNVINQEKQQIDANDQSLDGKVKSIAQLGAATSELQKQGMLTKKMKKMKKRMKK